jgi:GntR family transcriptional regulator
VSEAGRLFPLDRTEPISEANLGPLPLWFHVCRSLRESITNRAPDDGLRLPTEAELARHYRVSVATVRQALATLEAEGLVSRQRRRGTFIRPTPPRASPLRLVGSVQSMLDQQESESAEVLGRARLAVPRRLAAYFPGEAELVRFERLRFDHGEPVSYAENYLLLEHADQITDAQLSAAPMTKVLRDHVGVRLGRFDNELRAVGAEPRIARLLRTDLLAPVLHSHNVVYDQSGRAVDVAEISYRGDRFRYAVTVELPADEPAPTRKEPRD